MNRNIPFSSKKGKEPILTQRLNKQENKIEEVNLKLEQQLASINRLSSYAKTLTDDIANRIKMHLSNIDTIVLDIDKNNCTQKDFDKIHEEVDKVRIVLARINELKF